MAKRSGRGAGKGKLIIFMLVAVAALALYWNVSDKASKETQAPQHLYDLEKTGAGAVADYTATARRLHAAVDSGLSGGKFNAQTVQETSREVPRQAVEGMIRWHARQLLVTLPEEVKQETVEQALAGPVKNNGGDILGSQPDTFQGAPVVRIDVGVRDTLEGDALTLITDRIYLARQSRAAPPAPKPPAGSGQMAIIIDDFGYSSAPINAFAAIQRPLTFAVIPYRQFSNEAASRGLSSGHQVILHLPLEPVTAAEQSEPTTVTTAMSDQEIQQTVAKAIQAVPGIIGVNNHQGSKATADKRVMRTVLGTVKSYNLFFVDSRTSSQSVAFDLSRQMGLRTGENELFLDNSNDVGYIKGRLRTAMQMALKHGSVTVIGHARMNTAAAVREMIPELEAAGIKLVFASQLAK
ncbi:MAG TPA: divergent polysaccharide deacetylase family protein [Selenomonadales bacterium]|nr:divergent polysaccharide deacetylase family protein [Selenomonadales bacterium]